MDIVSDTIIRLKNASVRLHKSVYVKKSKLVLNILKCLYEEGYINGYVCLEKNILVYLKYKESHSMLLNVKRVSKLSKRVYMNYNEILKIWLEGTVLIVTTSEGVFSNRKICVDKVEKLGGEVLFKI